MKTNHYIPNHTLTKTDQGYVVNFIVEQNKLIPVFENMSLEQACQAMLIQEQILLQPTDDEHLIFYKADDQQETMLYKSSDDALIAFNTMMQVYIKGYLSLSSILLFAKNVDNQYSAPEMNELFEEAAKMYPQNLKEIMELKQFSLEHLKILEENQ